MLFRSDSFQVMQVPKCSQDLPFKVLQWSEVRLLLGNGYRSVGRDDIVDYGRPVPVARWEDRHALPRHGVEFFSIAVSTEDARRIARYATGRLLRHIRHLRPRGSLSSGWQYEDGAAPKIRLIFMQRYSFNIYPTRSVTGRLLSIGYDANDDDDGNEYPLEGQRKQRADYCRCHGQRSRVLARSRGKPPIRLARTIQRLAKSFS